MGSPVADEVPFSGMTDGRGAKCIARVRKILHLAEAERTRVGVSDQLGKRGPQIPSLLSLMGDYVHKEMVGGGRSHMPDGTSCLLTKAPKSQPNLGTYSEQKKNSVSCKSSKMLISVRHRREKKDRKDKGVLEAQMLWSRVS